MPAIEVTLRSIDRLDEIEERTLILQPNSTIPIGRSSKNSNKKLTAARDNAYIDSPVISREHATISTRPSTVGSPGVWLTDNASMHGTLVNGTLLPRRVEHRLNNGDHLQFGVDVIRDQETFIAKRYHFTSRPATIDPDRLYSRGISVPESSDEEAEHDITLMHSSPRPPRYGSQKNPVNIEDFEDVTGNILDLEDDEDDLPPEVASSKPAVEDKKVVEESMSPMLHPTVASVADAEQDLNSDEDDLESINSSQLAVLDDESQDGDSMGHSDAPMDSESEDSDLEDDNLDALRREKLGAMLDHEQQKSSISNTPSSPPPALPPRSTIAPGPTTLPRPSSLFDSFPTMDAGPLNWGAMSQPSLPPRPSAPKPFSYNLGMPSNQISEVNMHNPWFEDASVNMFGMPMSDYSLPSYNRAGPAYPQQMSRPYGTPTHAPQPPFSPENSTPLPKHDALPEQQHPVQPMTAALESSPAARTEEEKIIVTPQQSSRTKVSIAEIVEEPAEQPPTPTSMAATPNLKRKAEFLDAEEEEASEETATPEIDHQVVIQQVAVDQAVTERPKKKARKSRSGLFQYAAGAVVGAAAVVGGLLYVPEAWLQPGL